MIYCEQTSHHPPISHFLVEGPASNPFKMHGYLEYRVAVQGAFSSVRVSMPGRISLELPDGTKYESENPSHEVEGLMSDTKVLNAFGEMNVKDMTNGYETIV